MDASFIVTSLRKHYSSKRGEWAFFAELRVGTGFTQKHHEQRLDAWAINLYPSTGHNAIAFEVKVSRGDFRRELRDPAKRYSALMVSNLYYFVTPVGLVDPDEVPDLCGLMEVDEDGVVNTVKRATHRPKFNPSWTFLASLCRRVCEAEAGLPIVLERPAEDPQMELKL